MELTEADKKQLEEKGITKEKVLGQIETFKEGIPFVRLEKAAVTTDGISKFSETEEQKLIKKFEDSKESTSLLKFVPASGAASRMFKAMFNFLDTYDPKAEKFVAYLDRTKDKDVKAFFDGYKKFCFLRSYSKDVRPIFFCFWQPHRKI